MGNKSVQLLLLNLFNDHILPPFPFLPRGKDFSSFGAVEKGHYLLFAPKSPKGDLLIFRMLIKPPLGGRGQYVTFSTPPGIGVNANI
jgi:hypothetical protein